MYVKRTDDPSRAIVRDPITRAPLPADGCEVPDTDPYWLQLLAQGDVIRAAPPPVRPAAAAVPAEAEPLPAANPDRPFQHDGDPA